MPLYGISKAGFLIKPFQAILNDKMERAKEMFGSDVDLRSTSALRKILDVSSFEDQELWKRLEQLYYSNFISTASGDALDLLGEDLGVSRRYLHAKGTIKAKLSGETPGRLYHLPIGTLVETDPPAQRFRTTETASLSSLNKEAVVEIEALVRGGDGNIPANAIKRINKNYERGHLDLRGATISVSNEEPTTGGERLEDDTSYRERLLGYPRSLWTLEAVKQAVLDVDGVKDCLVFDPLGGVDVSQSYFNMFRFSERTFSSERRFGSPYFFDIVVATYPGVPWESEGSVTGTLDLVIEAIREVRPVSIFPNVIRANEVEIGVRATIKIMPGHDKDAILSRFLSDLHRHMNALRLGGDILYADVLCLAKEIPGVLDVQGLHLRRCPARFGTINFGNRLFRKIPDEAAIGENIALAPNEIAVSRIDSELNDIEVSDR